MRRPIFLRAYAIWSESPSNISTSIRKLLNQNKKNFSLGNFFTQKNVIIHNTIFLLKFQSDVALFTYTEDDSKYGRNIKINIYKYPHEICYNILPYWLK